LGFGRKINDVLKIEKQNKGYISKISEDLKKLIVANVAVPDDDEDENEWNISKACLNILNLMGQIVDLQTISKLYEEIANQIKNNKNNLNERAKCWLLLGSSITTNNKLESSKFVTNCLNIIFSDLQQNNELKLKKCVSFLIYKITKILSKINKNKKEMTKLII